MPKIQNNFSLYGPLLYNIPYKATGDIVIEWKGEDIR